MGKKIKLKLVFKALILASFLFSMPVDNIVVRNIAFNFNNNQLEIENIDTYNVNDEIVFYIVNFKPSGFLLISGDDKLKPIIGYSYNSVFDKNNLPEQLEVLLDVYAQNYFDIITNQNFVSQEVENLWKNYILDGFSIARDIEPLITANWDQGGSWNDQCPGNALVGCVAVSMAQIMYYWGSPYTGSGNTNYYHSDYGLIQADFENTEYDFDSMFDNSATASSQLLLFHSGVSVEMNYGESGSGAYVCYTNVNAKNSLRDYFNYDDAIQCVSRNNYNENQWKELLFDQLDRGWPIIYRAYTDGGGAGHAWNVDGYSGDLFHCNWGWGGSSNGYFDINSMNGFNVDQGATINIVPDGLESPIALFEYEIDNLVVHFTDLSSEINDVNIVEWNWNFGDGNFSNDSSPVHIYSDSGEYQVTLTVMNEYGIDGEIYYENIIIQSCSEALDQCGICGGDNEYLDCNGQCAEWSPICNDINFDGFIGYEACFGYIGLGSDDIFSDNYGNDDCGQCGGNNLTCTGCIDPNADNYNEFNLIDDGSCTYIEYGPGYALSFDGEGDYVLINDSSPTNAFDYGTEEFTITAWIKPSSLNATYTEHNIPNPFITNTLVDISLSSFIGEYYSNPGSNNSPEFGDLILTRYDDVINFNWGNGSPDPLIPNNDFQIRWSGTIFCESDGEYLFRSRTDDGVRLYIDDNLVIDHWQDQGPTNRYGSIVLDSGIYNCIMEFYENGGGATAELYWTPPGQVESLLSPASSSNNGNLELGVNNDGNMSLFLNQNCESDSMVFGDNNILIDEWNAIALIYNQGNISVSINNNIYFRSTCGDYLNESLGTNLIIGGSLYDNIYFNGQLDEVRILNYAMSEQNIYNYMMNRIDNNSEGLLAYWRFDEDEGTVVFDQSFSNNGLIYGDAYRVISHANYDPNLNYGDVNNDSNIDILDVIVLVDIVLGNFHFTYDSDLNNDGNIDVIDIIVLVDIILSN
tara:strand:+ start:636 stop:3557 length:2922 start_codon:yes stop_codon:yes gene_type:complete